MLPLNDLLWKKLDDAHRDRDIPRLLLRLSETWDDEIANSLFWDCLCHQGTCYGATYAAIPHLLEIARQENSRHQRFKIALFAGYVVQCALNSRQDGQSENQALPGLPETAEEWDRKLDPFRGLVASFENPRRQSSHYERTELLPRYRKVLRQGTVGSAEIDRIRTIKVEFLAALPTVSRICEQAFLENLQNENAMVPLMGGIAAAEGQLDLGNLLHQGSEGPLRCMHCAWNYEYILFGSQVAVYAKPESPPISLADSGRDNRPVLDWKEGAASRSDGFIVPVADDKTLTPFIVRLLLLANRGQAPKPAVLLRHFLGHFHCRRCDLNSPVCGV